jgi:PhnB protein
MNTNQSNRTIQPYLFFNGCCEQALEYYRKALGAEVQGLMRFKDSPEPPQPGCGPVAPEKIMHSQFRVGQTTIMASDGQCSGQTNFDGFSLALSVTTESEADQFFNALADGGKVCMPLAKTFWSPRFGMVQDRFGVLWMIMTLHPDRQK